MIAISRIMLNPEICGAGFAAEAALGLGVCRVCYVTLFEGDSCVEGKYLESKLQELSPERARLAISTIFVDTRRKTSGLLRGNPVPALLT